jgi:uncharacterized membrane protein
MYRDDPYSDLRDERTGQRRASFAPFLLGAGIGATVMCLLDPATGRRRRALIQDKTRHYATVAREGAGKTSRDLGNRLSGVRHRATQLLDRGDAPDEVVAERVRSKLGRFAAHPRSIDVEVHDGVARLSGVVGAGEAEPLVRRVRHIPGVREVESRLQPGEDIEPLEQRAAQWLRRFSPRARPTTGNGSIGPWNPSTRAAGAVAGAAALTWAMARRSPVAMAAGATGAALLARSLTNRPMAKMVGARSRGDVVRVRKTVSVDAPVEQVFRLWSHPEVFPRFLTHLRKVDRVGDRRYHWVATGPGGVDVSWDAEVTEIEPNRRLSWRSLGGSGVDTHGTVHLEPEEGGGTRVHVDMSYGPPAGLLGHSVAWLTRQDPRTAMNEDLLRLKSLLEDGRTTAHGLEVKLDDLLPSV